MKKRDPIKQGKIQPIVQQSLYKLCNDIHTSQHAYALYTSETILEDSLIDIIASVGPISSMKMLKSTLDSVGWHWWSSHGEALFDHLTTAIVIPPLEETDKEKAKREKKEEKTHREKEQKAKEQQEKEQSKPTKRKGAGSNSTNSLPPSSIKRIKNEGQDQPPIASLSSPSIGMPVGPPSAISMGDFRLAALRHRLSASHLQTITTTPSQSSVNSDLYFPPNMPSTIRNTSGPSTYPMQPTVPTQAIQATYQSQAQYAMLAYPPQAAAQHYPPPLAASDIGYPVYGVSSAGNTMGLRIAPATTNSALPHQTGPPSSDQQMAPDMYSIFSC
jgi:hypothetical protein